MSTNLRKAQKHMQRATELLNQSQLGFGVPDSTNGDAPNRNENKRLQNEINSGEAHAKKTKTDPMKMDLSKVPDKTQKEHIKLPCKHACMMWGAGARGFREQCIQCNALLIRFRSLSDEERKKRMPDVYQKDFEERQEDMDRLQIPETERNIDIMMEVDEVLEIAFSDGREIKLTCNFVEDLNNNITKIYKKRGSVDYQKLVDNLIEIFGYVPNKDNSIQTEEYWTIQNHTFICSAHTKWEHIKPRLETQMTKESSWLYLKNEWVKKDSLFR